MGNEIAATTENVGMTAQNPKAMQVMSIFSDAKSFDLAWKMAEALSRSTIVPKQYQGSPSNCLIAIEMASRINTSPMMVMQNLYVVNGSPGWSSQWIIAMINNSRRYKTELKFDLKTDTKGKPISCKAYAEDYNGNVVEGPVITMEMAEAEGWTKRNGSKWQTMPEVMIRYRSASFFGRLNCPDMIMGIYSQDEIIDGFSDPIEMADVTPVTETDPYITDEDHEKFCKEISKALPDADRDLKRRVYDAILKDLGVSRKEEITLSQLNKAIEMIPSVVAALNVEKADAQA